MEGGAVKRDEVFVDEAVAYLDVLVGAEPQGGADSVVGIEADAVAIASQHEEEVQRALDVGKRGEEAVV